MHDIDQKVKQVDLQQSQVAPQKSSIMMIGGDVDSIRNELKQEAILEVQGHKNTKPDDCKKIAFSTNGLEQFEKFKNDQIKAGVQTKGFKFAQAKPVASKPQLTPEQQRTKELELLAAKYNMGLQGPKITQHRPY